MLTYSLVNFFQVLHFISESAFYRLIPLQNIKYPYIKASRFKRQKSAQTKGLKIEKFSALSEPDIYGVIIGLENVIQNKLAEGKIVRFDRLGSLYPSLSSHPSGTKKK